MFALLRARIGPFAACLATALVLVSPSALANLSFTVLEPARTGPGDATYVFSGMVTNAFASSRNASDLFFDFSGFDPAVVSPAQIFGLIDFEIPAGTTTEVMDLFELHLGSGLVGTTYFADVTLQDVFGFFSAPLTVSVTIVEEPSTAWLLLAVGIAALVVGARDRRGTAA
jgi:hypothetical protein